MKSFLVFWNFGRGHYTKKREVIALFIANSHKICLLYTSIDLNLAWILKFFLDPL